MPAQRRAPPEQDEQLDVEANDRMRAELVSSFAKQEYYVDQYGNVAKRRQPPSLRKFKEEPLVPLGVSSAQRATLTV